MKNKIFYVLYIQDTVISQCIDAIRFICNPNEKRLAHITVIGPVFKALGSSQLEKKNEVMAGQEIEIIGVSKFFSDTQNTVFLDVFCPQLEDIWSKRDYGYHPHITLYDGSSRELANGLIRLLAEYPLRFSFKPTTLLPLTSKKGQRDFFPFWETSSSIFNELYGPSLNVNKISTLSEAERLNLVEKAVMRLNLETSGKILKLAPKVPFLSQVSLA